jgi:hypothetical protein
MPHGVSLYFLALRDFLRLVGREKRPSPTSRPHSEHEGEAGLKDLPCALPAYSDRPCQSGFLLAAQNFRHVLRTHIEHPCDIRLTDTSLVENSNRSRLDGFRSPRERSAGAIDAQYVVNGVHSAMDLLGNFGDGDPGVGERENAHVTFSFDVIRHRSRSCCHRAGFQDVVAGWRNLVLRTPFVD